MYVCSELSLALCANSPLLIAFHYSRLLHPAFNMLAWVVIPLLAWVVINR